MASGDTRSIADQSPSATPPRTWDVGNFPTDVERGQLGRTPHKGLFRRRRESARRTEGRSRLLGIAEGGGLCSQRPIPGSPSAEASKQEAARRMGGKRRCLTCLPTGRSLASLGPQAAAEAAAAPSSTPSSHAFRIDALRGIYLGG